MTHRIKYSLFWTGIETMAIGILFLTRQDLLLEHNQYAPYLQLAQSVPISLLYIIVGFVGSLIVSADINNYKWVMVIITMYQVCWNILALAFVWHTFMGFGSPIDVIFTFSIIMRNYTDAWAYSAQSQREKEEKENLTLFLNDNQRQQEKIREKEKELEKGSRDGK